MVSLTVRVDPDMIARMDDLIPKLQREPDIAAAGRVSRSTVLRLAVSAGLEALEKRFRE